MYTHLNVNFPEKFITVYTYCRRGYQVFLEPLRLNGFNIKNIGNTKLTIAFQSITILGELYCTVLLSQGELEQKLHN